jgi:hypothetical protein
MHKTPEITRLIHENFWTVLSFAFAQPVIGEVVRERFHGEWKYLGKTIYEHAEIRADRALLEMATQLRVLDDAEKLNDYLKEVGAMPFGKIVQGDGSETDLHFRDMTNKILHAQRFEWDLSNVKDPFVICHSQDVGRWRFARISLVRMMALVGQLMH